MNAQWLLPHPASVALFCLALLVAGPASCKKKDDAPSLPLTERLPAWDGTLTELLLEEPSGWIYANVDSLRTSDELDSYFNEVESTSDSALAVALVDASQLYVAYPTEDPSYRLSIVRTNVPAEEIAASLREDDASLGVEPIRDDAGLQLWVDAERTQAVAVPAENILLVGPPAVVSSAAMHLLNDGGTDELSRVRGVVFGATLTPALRAKLLEMTDESMVHRSLAGVTRVTGRGDLTDGLQLDLVAHHSRSGSAGLLATVLRIGWRRLAPELLGEYFQEDYVDRLLSGIEISTEDSPAGARTLVSYSLPAADTSIWLRVLTEATPVE